METSKKRKRFRARKCCMGYFPIFLVVAIPNWLISLCLGMLMVIGVVLLFYSIIKLTRRNTPAQITLPGIKLELKGPAWLIVTFFGVIMTASPLIAAQLQQPEAITVPSESTQQVANIREPNYKSFRFTNDVSVLDLRTASTTTWYNKLFNWQSGKKSKIRPAILRNYMLVKKLEAIDEIHLVYAASGELDVRCLTHDSHYAESPYLGGERLGHVREVIADISAVPVGEVFEIIIEGTYWDSFSGESGDDYTTYTHKQAEPESVSVALIFPDEKRFTSVTVQESILGLKKLSPFKGVAKSFTGEGNLTYYWSTLSTRQEQEVAYKLSWKW